MQRQTPFFTTVLAAGLALVVGCSSGPAPTALNPTTTSTTVAVSTSEQEADRPADIETPDDVADRSPFPTAVDALFSELDSSDFSGVVMVQHDDATHIEGYGLADREANVPIDENTVFDIGSVTKQFTGAAILRLEMDGALNVDDKLADHLPNVPIALADLTLHQLLTHTAGLPDGLGDDYEPVDLDTYLARAASATTLAEPGELHAYSNTGYSLLGAVIESVAGTSFERYVNDALFAPAGMTNTGYVLPDWPDQTVAVGYDQIDGAAGRPNELPWDTDGPYWNLRANGGILSTAPDMLRWHEALLGTDILDDTAKSKLFARHVTEGEGSQTFYGYGWALFPTPDGGTLVTHNGGNGIFFADFLRFVDHDAAIFVATNAATSDYDALAFEVADALLGLDLLTEYGGVDDGVCGLDNLFLEDLVDFAVIGALPETPAGALTSEWLEILDGADAAARTDFAKSHISPALAEGVSAEFVAAEIANLQEEFAGTTDVAIYQQDAGSFHVLRETADGIRVVMSTRIFDDEPDHIRCVGVLYE